MADLKATLKYIEEFKQIQNLSYDMVKEFKQFIDNSEYNENYHEKLDYYKKEFFYLLGEDNYNRLKEKGLSDNVIILNVIESIEQIVNQNYYLFDSDRDNKSFKDIIEDIDKKDIKAYIIIDDENQNYPNIIKDREDRIKHMVDIIKTYVVEYFISDTIYVISRDNIDNNDLIDQFDNFPLILCVNDDNIEYIQDGYTI